jgi:tripartite-type tricarboxylate transporter receptor subunit TctC
MAGVDMVHTAYKGTGAVMPDLLSGRVPMMFENLAVMTRTSARAPSAPARRLEREAHPLMPEVPTVAETDMGLEGVEVLGWFVLLAPARTPQEIVRTLNAELNKMIARPQIVAKFAELGRSPWVERSSGRQRL